MNQEKWDIRFLNLAKSISKWSKDPSTQVGAVIVAPDKHIISTGFNGFAQKMPDNYEFYNNREEKYSRIIHAELNALIFTKESLNGATLYTYPFLTCDRCCVLMIQAGIVRLVAPKLNTEAGARWEPTFVKSRKYCQECNVVCDELEVNIDGK